MNKKFTIFGILITLFLFALSNQRVFGSISIRITGTWSELIDDLDLQNGPGSDLNNTYESSPSTISVNITGAGQKNWRVDIRKDNSGWPGSFMLYVRRTSDGTGNGNISGGTVYQEVTDVDNEFFSGYGNRGSIYIQLKLDGVSAQVPFGTYLTTVYYTVTDF